MGLKTAAEYVASLRDGLVTYWDGERIDDITTHPRFRVPIEVASRDYDYADPGTARCAPSRRRRMGGPIASSRCRATRPTSPSASS